MNLSPKLLPENMNLQKKISEDTEKKNVCTSTFFPIATYYILKYAWAVLMFCSEVICTGSLQEERR